MPAPMTRHGHTAMAANDNRSIEGNRHVRALQPAHGQGRPSQSRPLPTFRGTGPTVVFLLVCAVGLIPWTVGMAVTLPARYVVGSWTLIWAGLDIPLLVCFAVTAWALWNQRPIALPAAVFTSALLLSDAWFDVLTAHGGRDLLVSAATALLGEIPGAIVLAAISIRLLRANAPFRAVDATGDHPPRLWPAPLGSAFDQPHRPPVGGGSTS
jgi:hypothetical protein